MRYGINLLLRNKLFFIYQIQGKNMCDPAFATALKAKLTENRLTNTKFCQLMGITAVTLAGWLKSDRYPNRNNILEMRKVLRLSIEELDNFLILADKEPLIAEEIRKIKESSNVWFSYEKDYDAYNKTMVSHHAIEEVTKHISNRNNPLLVVTPKAQFHNIHIKVLKGFISNKFREGNCLEVIPPFIEDEIQYFSSLAEQLSVFQEKAVSNNNDFKNLLSGFIRKKDVPTFLLIRHLGNIKNAEIFARILRSIIDSSVGKKYLYPIWIAGEKLEKLANKPTDSVFSIGRLLYNKAEIVDIQLLAYDWEIDGVNYDIANKIFELTGGHYMSVEYCLDYFRDKNQVPSSKLLQEYLSGLPLFNEFIDQQEMLNKFLKQDIINVPVAHLAFLSIVNSLYFGGLLKKINEKQFTWINPIIRQIGLDIMQYTV